MFLKKLVICAFFITLPALCGNSINKRTKNKRYDNAIALPTKLKEPLSYAQKYPLHDAIQKKQTGNVLTLLQQKHDPNQLDKISLETYRTGNPLLDSINNKYERTPLYLATEKNLPIITELLLLYGANPKKESKIGRERKLPTNSDELYKKINRGPQTFTPPSQYSSQYEDIEIIASQ